MLGKIFNKGKQKEFYLSVEENVSEAIDEAKETVAAVTESVQESVAETVEKVTEGIESTPSPQEIVEEVAPSVSKSTKAKASKKTAKGKSQTAVTQKSETKPKVTATSGASSWEQPFWVKAMYNNTASDNSAPGKKTEATFATDYLIVQSTSRRRPGPSLNKFKAMVNQKKF